MMRQNSACTDVGDASGQRKPPRIKRPAPVPTWPLVASLLLAFRTAEQTGNADGAADQPAETIGKSGISTRRRLPVRDDHRHHTPASKKQVVGCLRRRRRQDAPSAAEAITLFDAEDAGKMQDAAVIRRWIQQKVMFGSMATWWWSRPTAGLPAERIAMPTAARRAVLLADSSWRAAITCGIPLPLRQDRRVSHAAKPGPASR